MTQEQDEKDKKEWEEWKALNLHLIEQFNVIDVEFGFLCWTASRRIRREKQK